MAWIGLTESWTEGVDFAYQQKTPTQRSGIFIFVVLLHAMIIHVLATGLASQKVEVIHRPVEVRIIKEEIAPLPQATPPSPSPSPPSPLPPSSSRPRPQKPVVKPTVKPAPKPTVKPAPKPTVKPAPKIPARRPIPQPPAPAAVERDPAAVASVAPPPAPTLPSPAASEPAPAAQEAQEAPVASVETAPAPPISVRTAPVVNSRFCGKPEYPSASRRYEESGTVVLNFLIDTDGRVVQSKIEASSGYERLDEAARQALSLCRFKPGTVDGKPEKSWHKLKYVWKLDDE